MALDWIHETAPSWDAGKESIIGTAAEGIFRLDNYRSSDVIPGDWWHVEREGKIVGYGWMDANFGDAEVLLAVAPDAQGDGVGTFILEQLAKEAATHGLNYMYNVVNPQHPRREAVTGWLSKHGFERSHDDESLRRRVGGS
jgi:N-acetylglutamate synthase-like GNAT family acetyltransferase